MRSILKLLKANLRHGKGSFKGLILLMALLTFSFSGTISNNDQLDKAQKQRFEEGNVGDYIIFINEDALTDEMTTCLDQAPSAESYQTTEMLIPKDTIRIDGESSETVLFLLPQSDRYNIFDGKSTRFDNSVVLNPGEILLSYKLHLYDEFKIGSKITIHTHDGWDEEFTVKGFFEDYLLGGMTILDNRCMIAPSDFERLKTEKTDRQDAEARFIVLEDIIEVYAKDGATAEDIRAELNAGCDIIRASNAATTKQYLADAIQMYSSNGTKIVFVSVIMLLLVILISMHNNIRSSIDMEYQELGILKSQGFTSRDIRMVFVLQYVLALVIGSILGLIISVPALHYLIGLWTNISGIVSETGVSFGKCALVCLSVIVICIGFILLATRRVSRISPVVAISGGKEEVFFDSHVKTKIRKKPLSFFIALRQILSSVGSYIGTGLIVTMVVFFVITISILSKGLSTDALFSSMKGDLVLVNYGGLTINNIEEYENTIRSVDPGAELTTESGRRMEVEGDLISVYSYHTNDLINKPTNGRAPIYANEIMVGIGLSDSVGKKIGDTISVRNVDHTEEFVITGYFETALNFGQVAIVTDEGMLKLGYDFVESALVKVSEAEKIDAVRAALEAKYPDAIRVKEYEESRTMSILKKVISVVMDALAYALYVIVLIFVIVVVSMVCKRAFIKERKDIGIYKAFGFTSTNLRVQFALRFALVAGIGADIGSLLAIFFAKPLIRMILSAVHISDFVTDSGVLPYFIPATLICLSFFVFAYLLSRKVKKVEVRELITE